MNLHTTYMGLKINSPVIVSSSGFSADIEKMVQAQKAGAGAIVLKSLFEEQIIQETAGKLQENEMYFWFPEANDQISKLTKEQGVADYLQLIKDAKKALDIPVIASINCMTSAEWPAFAAKIQDAGADGLELNIAIIPRNDDVDCCALEMEYVQIVEEVCKNTSLPVSVKIGSHFTNLSQLCKGLCQAGAKNIVMFNRYYQPDINIENLEIVSNDYKSKEGEYSESLRWIALLSNNNYCELTASTGYHTGHDVVKALLAGASAVQVATTLYQNGIEYIAEMLTDIQSWMQTKSFDTIEDFKGKLSQNKEATVAFERVQFMKKTFGI